MAACSRAFNGGFDLAAEWMGWENVFHCEINPFGQKILKYYWPNAISYTDITKTDFSVHRGEIDILTGGFPCQPFSTAGKRKGTEDARHLWPEMLRAIREIQPRYIVGENVRGITNWNGGLVFDQVQADLEAEGYEVLPFLLPAAGVDARHERYRIWFVAHARRITRAQSVFARDNEQKAQWGREKEVGRKNREFSKVASGLPPIPEQGWLDSSFTSTCTYGLSKGLDGITIQEWTTESLKGGGNAIVPQVAFEIFTTINLINCI